jgi:hypothetical protein
MLYRIRKLIKYEIKMGFSCKRASGVADVGCGIFKTKTVMMIAMIASKNVSNLVVSISDYLLVLV